MPKSRLVVGDAATEESLREYGRDSGIVYVAARSSFRQDNPMFSTIELADSQLSLFDLYNLQLRAELVVLSGCEMTTRCDGDELIGLTRPSLCRCASGLGDLWQTDHDSKLLFMRSFLDSVSNGSSMSMALQKTMAKVRKSHPHPFYWAPYVLVGKPRGD